MGADLGDEPGNSPLLVDQRYDSPQVNCITQILTIFEPIDIFHHFLSNQPEVPKCCVLSSGDNYGIAKLPNQDLQLPKTANYAKGNCSSN
jgi:hypothetical protein